MATIRPIASASVSFALLLALLSAPAEAQHLDIADAKVIDLTHPIDANTIF